MDLLLEVWREVSEHLDIDASCARLSALLAPVLSHRALIVRRIEHAESRLLTVAEGVPPRTRRSGLRPQSELSAQHFARLLDWCAEHRVAHVGPERSPTAARFALSARNADAEALVGPLFDGTRVDGVVVVLAAVDGAGFGAQAVERLTMLLSPLGTALRNDQRLHELERLRHAVEADNRRLRQRVERQDMSEAIIGETAGLRGVMAQVEQVAATDVPVLLIGETGSGKEVIARAIHKRSRRAEGPLIKVNCGAIPPELADSELFGHERGSFTGALGARAGLFERADGGTLLLDEVGELMPLVQVRLLRVLQDGSLQRVGGSHTIHVDVRIIAATHRDLRGMVGRGDFREDLWFRLGVFPILVPPLRERRHDIPALAAYFARGAGMRTGGAPLVPGEEELAQLVAYEWPGNVRELAAVIERAAILGSGRRLEVAAALGGAGSSGARTQAPAGAPNSTSAFPTLDEAMRRHIEAALARTRGTIEGRRGAAALLGVNPHTLRARMRKLGIDWARFRDAAD